MVREILNTKKVMEKSENFIILIEKYLAIFFFFFFFFFLYSQQPFRDKMLNFFSLAR